MIVATAFVAVVFAPAAGASQLIDRDARGVRLEVNDQGLAMITYRARGRLRHVLARGAVNALPQGAARRQVAFRVDYSGGWGMFRRDAWKTFRNSCTPARPPLRWLVAGVPRTRRLALGCAELATRAAELRPASDEPAGGGLGTAALALDRRAAQLTVRFDWAYRRYRQLYGRLTYYGRPVHGFHSTSTGQPLDSRVDTFDSVCGTGW